MNRLPARAALATVILPLAWGLVLASALAGASAIALTLALDGAQATEMHQSDHTGAHPHAGGQHPAQTPASAQPGTTAALRTAMTRLRQTLQTHRLGALDTPAALRLQRALESDIAALIAECDLPAEADAVLHGVLVELNRGTAALAGPASRDAGLKQLDGGLHAYAELFAAPHWSQAAIATD